MLVGEVLEVGDLTLDLTSREAWRGTTAIHLSPREFSLLETFMRRPGAVLPRAELLNVIWARDGDRRSNVVDVYVGYLRNKIDKPFGTRALETVWRAGYRLRSDAGR